MKKVIIVKAPTYRGGGMFGPQTPPKDQFSDPNRFGSTPNVKTNDTLRPVSRSKANLEAERNETVVTNLNGDGLPEMYTVGGKPHSQGGTPLNLPDNSFIFSQTPGMKIKDSEILKMFGKTGTKNMTPAKISKQYDLNEFRKILADKDSTKLERDTAERMIKNYNNKLGALALVQESMKGFDKGIPSIAMGFLENNGISPEELIMSGISEQPVQQSFKKGGSTKVIVTALPKAQNGLEVTNNFDKRLGSFEQDYLALAKKFEDPDVRKAFVEKYKERLKATKPNAKTKLTQADIDRALSMESDDIINTYLYGERKNMALTYNLSDMAKADKEDLWDKNPNLAHDAAIKLGYKAFDPSQTAAFQAGYFALGDLISSKELGDKFKDMQQIQTGLGDEQYSGTKAGTISQIDGWLGNTTAGQATFLRNKKPATKKEDDVEETQNIKHLQEYRKEAPARFWTPDLVNLAGAASDYLTAKEYHPWQAPLVFEGVSPEFTDFRGAAARIASEATGLADASSTFAGPQGQVAMHTNIQRNTVNPILQLQENENQANVGVANQFALYTNQARNNFNQKSAEWDTNLFDKQTIANQQFDNAKKAYSANVRNMFNNAWANRGYTQTMNSMNDDYSIDPVTGFLNFTPSGRLIKPTNGTKTTYSDQAGELMKVYPNLTWDQAIKLVKLNAGYPVTQDEEVPPKR